MALAFESNTDLAFDTTELRNMGAKYSEIAVHLRVMAKKLNSCLVELKQSGWTTPAGSAFQKMAETNWEANIEKYAAMLDTLRNIIENSAMQYDNLVSNHIEQTQL